MTIRTGDYAQFQRTLGHLVDVQSRIREANVAVASGKRVHSYKALGNDANTLVRTETALGTTRDFAHQNQKLVDRMQRIDGSMAEIKDLASELRQLLVARRNPATGDAMALDVELAGISERLTAKLNLQVEGRYVFGGSRTDTQPVDPTLVADDPANGTYYQGDGIELTARIDVGVDATYGVLADEQPFRDFFGALKLASEGHALDDATILADATQLAERALEGVIDRRAELGTATARVEGVKDSQETTMLYLEERLSGLVDTDVPEAMAQIAQDQVALEASFALLAQLSRLSLTDYLR